MDHSLMVALISFVVLEVNCESCGQSNAGCAILQSNASSLVQTRADVTSVQSMLSTSDPLMGYCNGDSCVYPQIDSSLCGVTENSYRTHCLDAEGLEFRTMPRGQLTCDAGFQSMTDKHSCGGVVGGSYRVTWCCAFAAYSLGYPQTCTEEDEQCFFGPNSFSWLSAAGCVIYHDWGPRDNPRDETIIINVASSINENAAEEDQVSPVCMRAKPLATCKNFDCGAGWSLMSDLPDNCAAATCSKHQCCEISPFRLVNEGDGRACRGSAANDNEASYYSVFFGVTSIDACKVRCMSEEACQGIEFHSGHGRCEVWTRPEGIQATQSLAGYTCLHFDGAPFHGVDGGVNRVCRGSSMGDNSADYYNLSLGVSSLEICMQKCFQAAVCKGIEYKSDSGRCEVWTRMEGIETAAPASGYACLRYEGASMA